MPKKLHKSFQIYLSKLKKKTAPHVHFPSSNSFHSTGKILSDCRYPKTPSFSIYRKASMAVDPDNAATLSDVDRFLFENFKSLYFDGEKTGEEEDSGTGRGGRDPFGSTRIARRARVSRSGSDRFFKSIGVMGSLMEEASRVSSTTSFSEETGKGLGSGSGSSTSTLKDAAVSPPQSSSQGDAVPLPDDCIAVLTHSSDPYEDFRRSMEEMMASRFEHGARVDWDFMEELLFCYLNLNEKKSYKFVLGAFVDLVVVLRKNSSRVSTAVPVVGRSCRKVRANGGRRKKSIDSKYSSN